MTYTQKMLNKWVKTYSDPTVPESVIDEKVAELTKLHDEGKFLFNEESVYNNMRGVIRVKNPTDCIAQVEEDMDDDSDSEVEVEL